jgi:hypothetical protein
MRAARKSGNDLTGASYRGLIVALAGLVFLQVAVAAAWNKWFRHDAQSSVGVIPQMQEFTRERRYDDAVELGQYSLRNVPSDDIILQQIALVHLRRAQIEATDKERYTVRAVASAEKALRINPTNQMDIYATARVRDIAGDYSAENRCEHYKRSVLLFESRVQFLTGESMQVEGKAVPTQRLLQENEYLLQRVRAKMSKAGCR